jgi:flagellar assembly factor FliW
MKIEGTRFGIIEFESEDVIRFPQGMIGFPESKEYVLVSTKEESPFRWLQSLTEPQLAFLLADPDAYLSEYQPELPEGQLLSISLQENGPVLIYATAAIPKGQPMEMTLNLAAPVVINAEQRLAAQIVLEEGAYTMKHRVFNSVSQGNTQAAA